MPKMLFPIIEEFDDERQVVNGLVMYKGRIFLTPELKLKQKFLEAVHGFIRHTSRLERVFPRKA